MNSSVIRTTPPYPIRLVAGVVAVVLAAAVAASAISLSNRAGGGDENAVDRCERSVRGVTEGLAAAGVDIDSADHRRKRFAAFAACLENPDTFARRVGRESQRTD
jgi:hypothetical protein